LIDRYAREDVEKAIGYLKEALGRDPELALGWAELSRAFAREAAMGWAPVEEGFGRAREAVERAVSLDPDLPEGHAELGWIQMYYDWDFRGAEASFGRALELAPGSAPVLRGAGVLARNLGRLEEAIGLYRRALEQDPLSAPSYHNLGMALGAMDRFVEAKAAHREALELAPQGVGTRGNLSLTLLALGRGEEALAEAGRESDQGFRLYALAIIHHGLGHAAESDAALEELIEKCSEVSAFQIAEVYGARGEVDRGFEWLERAYEQRDGGLATVKVSTCLRSLHGDPRWGALLRKMGLEG
jgi:tetratricopeptide (TPR) repeat protein